MFYFCTITKLKNVKLCHRKSGTLYLKVLTLDKKGRIRTDSHKRPHTGSDTHRDLVMLVPSLSVFVPLKYLVFTSSLKAFASEPQLAVAYYLMILLLHMGSQFSVTPPRLPVKVLPTGPRPSLASPTYSLDSPPMYPPVCYATTPLLVISSDLGLQWLGGGPGFPARDGLGCGGKSTRS